MSISRGSEWRQWDLHVHTASSFDYKYKSENADELLVKAWKDNGIEAVAITDHFIIDAQRIKRLKELSGSDVTIFPGVELRTDKGSTNLHIIAIFPESQDLNALESSFNAIMIDDKAKANGSPETIYWDYNDIIEYTHKREGVLSIHTGDKANGLDEEISNTTLFKMAIKKEYASTVPIFEVSNMKDIVGHKTKVFPKIGLRPIIICSDNHDPRNYQRKEKLWIKADRTFDGLMQVINHPDERVFIGEKPPKEEIADKRKSVYIDSVKVKKEPDAKNINSTWFNIDIPINKGLSVIIGNKGSGKSALADIIGLLCDANTMQEASFLNPDRFKKGPQRYADDYSGHIAWLDGKVTQNIKLSSDVLNRTTQYAQYLPQKFIERICTDLERDFQDEINKVIFSYVDATVKGESKNLDELVSLKSHPFTSRIKAIQDEIYDLNSKIIIIESRLISQYKKSIVDGLTKAQEMLDRHRKAVPLEVKKPKSKLTEFDQKRLEVCEKEIITIEKSIEHTRNELTTINTDISILTNSIIGIEEVLYDVEILNARLSEIKKKYFKDDVDIVVKINTPKEIIESKIELLKNRRDELGELLNDSQCNENSFNKKLRETKSIRNNIIETADVAERSYQKYLEDLRQWGITRDALLGDETSQNTVVFYKSELDRIDSEYPAKYTELLESRIQKVKAILIEKSKIVDIHTGVYSPIEKELSNILINMTECVNFKAKVVLIDPNIGVKLLNYVNHTYAGIFNGTSHANNVIYTFIRDTDFSDETSVIQLLRKVITVVDENLDKSSDIIKDKGKFYELLFGLDYIGVEFNLNYDSRDLKELSPGERGLVLLIFYLALNKGEEPLIIDQPEDNLDNESVYLKLVPCIREAKKKRQIIVVTHNPNIAIACDAEQVIHCQINKAKNEITYTSGSIENSVIRQKIIDVLEGTKPAFELRSKKYNFGSIF